MFSALSRTKKREHDPKEEKTAVEKRKEEREKKIILAQSFSSLAPSTLPTSTSMTSSKKKKINSQTTLIHSPGGTLVGTDSKGNRYFERMSPDEQYGRHRWVVYGELDCHRGQDPTTVPAEWHGWLHNITDDAPSRNPAAFDKYAWSLPHRGFSSNTAAAYLPKGHWSNPARRNWKKVSTWDGGQ